MQNDPTDKFFREKTSEHGENFSMSEWPVLEERVQEFFEKRRKRRFIFFLIIFFLVVTGGYLITVNMKTNPNTAASEVKQAINSVRNVSGSEKDNGGSTSNGEENSSKTSTEALLGPTWQNASEKKTETSARSSGSLHTARKAPDLTRAGNKMKERTEGPATSRVALTTREEKSTNTAPLHSPADVPDTVTAASNPLKREEKKKQQPAVQPEETEEASERFGWVDLHAGWNYTNPLLSGEADQPGYFKKRRMEESGTLKAAYGVSFHFKADRIIGSFGVDIVSYGETVDYSTEAVKRFRYVSGGQFVYYDSTVTNPSFVAKKENRLNYVEFPLYVGYEFPTRGKIGISVMGGLSMGFLVGSVNTYIDTALTGARSFENRKNETFRQQVFSVGLLPSLEYRMRSSSEFYIAFPVRYQLSSVMHHDSGIKQRYLSPGVQFGYRISLKGQ